MRRINNKITVFLTALLSALIMVSCFESYMGLEKKQTDAIPPGKVTVKEVIPKSGALEIHFTLSKEDADIAQVVASYVNQQGKQVEFNVSRYTTSILVEGLMGTNEVNVDLKCVDNSGNESEISFVKAAPLKSPVELAKESMQVNAAFGGVKVDWENKVGDLLVIHILTEDTLQVKGESVFIEDPEKRIYTRDTIEDKTFAYVRQYPDVEQKFGFVVTDKWGNRSDTLIGVWTPFREDVIMHQHVDVMDVFNWTYSGSQTKDYDAEGVNPETGIQYDGMFHAWTYRPSTLFDGSRNNAFHCTKFTRNLNDGDDSTNELVNSVYATYDMNIDARLSRMKVYWRNNAYLGNSTKRWRFWGTNDANADRFTKFPETWTLVGEYVAPDAADPFNITPEEAEAAIGMEFSILDDNVNPEAKPLTSFRYLRIEMMEGYDINHKIYTWTEIALWGQIENKYYE